VLIACGSGSKSIAGAARRRAMALSLSICLDWARQIVAGGFARERNPVITAIDSNAQGRLRVGLFAACKRAA
jgi:hypothetical protein